MKPGQSQPVVLSGRVFSAREVEQLQETVGVFSKLSRFELAQTLCEHLGWVTAKGHYKVDACLKALRKLEQLGQIQLPRVQACRVRQAKPLGWGEPTDPGQPVVGSVEDFEPVELEAVESSPQMKLWNQYLGRYHYLGYQRPFGAHQRYFIVSRKAEPRRLGCLLFAASAWAVAVRDEWIGWSATVRAQRLNWVVNNSRFLIFPWVRLANLASRALALATRRVGLDWQRRYGYRPVLLETFVDPQRYRGTCYQAANWIRLGETAGRGRLDRHKRYLSTRKLVYVYPLRPDFRRVLKRRCR
ncbi:MAG: DUF4338 domain-containing protein [Ignavibacteria bacterium]|nr:MAG: DUF4338 domain-containing protein [Ignavibacteria bacterium]